MNNPKLLAVLTLLLTVVVYVRFIYEPVNWRMRGIAEEGADGWLERREGNDKLEGLVLSLPSDITMDGWRAAGTMTAVEQFGIRSSTRNESQRLPHAAGLRELRSLPALKEVYIWMVEFPPGTFAALAELPAVEDLRVDYPAGVTSADVARLGRLKSLKSLQLTGVLIDEECMRGLARLPALETLDLAECQVTDAHLAFLGEIETLQVLRLRRNRIRGNGLAVLARLPNLVTLNLSGNPIDPDGIAHLPAHSGLWILTLRGGSVTDEVVTRLPQLPQLFSLELSGSAVTDECLAHVGQYSRLWSLSLPRGVTGSGLRHLHRLKRLNDLSIYPPLESAAVESLKRALPECEIYIVD